MSGLSDQIIIKVAEIQKQTDIYHDALIADDTFGHRMKVILKIQGLQLELHLLLAGSRGQA